MKDARYFSHDTGARNDPKLIELQIDMGGLGLGIYWCLIEMLYENEGFLPYKPKTLAFSLRWATAEEVEQVIMNYDLFDNDGTNFWSNSALKRIAMKDNETQKKREAGRKGGQTTQSKNQAQNEQSSSTAQAPLEQNTSDAQAINKLINKEINKYISLTRADARDDNREKYFEIFFFDKNCRKPDLEIERFIQHYEASNWTRKGDTKPADHIALAKAWRPAAEDPNFSDPGILAALKTIYNKILQEADLKTANDTMRNIYCARVAKGNLVITMKTEQWGLFVLSKLPIQTDYKNIEIRKKSC